MSTTTEQQRKERDRLYQEALDWYFNLSFDERKGLRKHLNTNPTIPYSPEVGYHYTIVQISSLYLMLTAINPDMLLSHFMHSHPHIHHSLNRKQVQEFLDSHSNERSLEKLADYFSDYLLANNLADEVEE